MYRLVRGVLPCPFCNGTNVHTVELENTWVLNHSCPVGRKYDLHHTVNISVYGLTEKQVIDKWNKRK